MKVASHLMTICLILGSICVLSIQKTFADVLDENTSVKTARAVRITRAAPKIDGLLNDAIWNRAPIFENFLQQEPFEGKAATERTTFQIAYDEEALYVGIRCYDSDPQQIASRLTRRDGEAESDWVMVSLDPHLDKQTGCFFGVYASGAVADGIYSDDHRMDDAWDGVWEVETAIHDKGWNAEFKIPYHVLRFSPKKNYVWGFNIERHINRKQEKNHWNLMSKNRPGIVSQFGRLQGIQDIHPPMHLELMPYAMGRSIVNNGSDFYGNVGTDIRYSITSSTSLNATLNPDFGQVEADPAQLNLTAFEDFYSERRPFFVEGASIFDVGGYDLFYSRRIGRQPGFFDIPDDAEETDRPESTTILGALKLTGKTEGKTTFGILSAVTSAEYATITRDVNGQQVTEDFQIEPLTSYLVGRVKQDILSGTSSFGIFGSTVHRRNAKSAYVGAADWNLKFRENTLAFDGTLATSQTWDGGQRKRGYITEVEIEKSGGWLEMDAGFAAASPGADLNDLGFLRRGDLIESWGGIGLYRHAPKGPFLRYSSGISSSATWNYEGLDLDRGINANFWGTLTNQWRVHLHVGREFGAMNDSDVRRGGVVIKSLAESWIHTQLETDARKPISFSFRPDYRRHDGGQSHGHGLRVGIQVRPMSNVWFSVEPRYSYRVTDAQWVDDVTDATGTHYVYGELTSKTLDFTTRARMSFSPKLSLELFLQPFIAVGDYTNFKELVAEKTYQFKPYTLNENRDFHRRSLKSNLVLRWEFLPGSTFFAVWSQARSISLDDPTAEDLEFRPFSRLGSSFSDDGDNIFLTKISYWFGS